MSSRAGNENRRLQPLPEIEEVSEEIIVWGESGGGSSGGGGTDVLTPDPWMGEFHVDSKPMGGPLSHPNPHPKHNTPEVTLCERLAQDLLMQQAALAAGKVELANKDSKIATANSPADKKALRQEKQAIRDRMKVIEKEMSDLKKQMKELKC